MLAPRSRQNDNPNFLPKHLLTKLAVVLVILSATLCILTITGRTQSSGRSDHIRREIYNGKEVVAGQVLVKFSPTARGESIARVKAEIDAEFDKGIGGIGSRLLRSRSKNTAAILRMLLAHPDVLYAEPDYIVRVSAVPAVSPTPASTPNDPGLHNQWGLINNGQTIEYTSGEGTSGTFAGTQGADVDAQTAWETTTGSANHVVGVVDTGIDYNHLDLADNVWSAPTQFSVTVGGQTVTCSPGTHGFNAIASTCDPADDNFHGTHVSGIIGAKGNDQLGVVGVNHRASLMGLKFIGADGSGSVSDAINALEFAVQVKQFFAGTSTPVDVRVLSNSWNVESHSQALLEQIRRTNENSMLFVASAGNGGGDGIGDNSDVTPSYPASYGAPPPSSTPGLFEPVSNVVSVAATDYNDSLTTISNFGAQTVHLAAPGEKIYSTAPGNGYRFLDGTSQAAAFVSGAAALLLSRCSVGTADLKRVMLDNVDTGAAPNQTITGGRLNVTKALQACANTGAKADLSAVVSDSPDPVKPGESLTYRVFVTNSGPSGVTEGTVTAQLPEGVTVVTASPSPLPEPSPSPTPGPQTLTFNLGELAANSTANFTIVVTAPTSPGNITFTATVGGSDDPDLSNNTATERTRVSTAKANNTTTTLHTLGIKTYGDSLTISAGVKADKESEGVINEGSVKFSIKRTSDGLVFGPTGPVAVTNGEASVTLDVTNSTTTGIDLSELNVGGYVAVAEYNSGEDSKFKDSSDTESFDIDQRTLTVEFIGPCATLYGTDAGCLSLDNLVPNYNDPNDPNDNVYSNGLVRVTGFVFNQNFETIGDQVTLVAQGYAGSSSQPRDYPMELGGVSSDERGKGRKAKNYNIVYVRPENTFFGFLVVQKAPLTITTKDSSKIYGAPNPAFEVKYEGFVLGEGPSVLGGTLNFTTAANAYSEVGAYPVTPGGLTSGNYEITFVPGTLTVDPAPTYTSVTEVIAVPGAVQYSDLVNLQAIVTAPNAIAQTAVNLGGSVAFRIGGKLLTPTGQIKADTSSGVLNLSGDFIITEAPGAYSVVGVFTPVSRNVLGSSDDDPAAELTVLPEDTRVAYNGVVFVSTPSANASTAVMTLRATIQDITSVAGDSDYDTYAGDIRKATVTFINRDAPDPDPMNPLGYKIIAKDLPVKLLDPPDAAKTGIVAYDWSVDIGQSDSQSFNVGIVVGGYYKRNNTSDDTVVTVSKPLGSFITGGGFLIMSNSAGSYPGGNGTKANFGFNVKYNKALTRLQGNAQVITRSGGRVYKIKSNVLSSLGVSTTNVGGKANFNGKASIQDVTDPLAPISIDGNASLQITLTDNGEPGSSDTIGITLWDKNSKLWFSSHWAGTPPKTVEKLLGGASGGGNVVVR
jgi:uncharacterized repeat protein (TIGR01451 family)